MTKRRPRAKVIADSEAITASGVQRVALEELDAADAALLLGHRAQARAALGDAAVVVAVDEVGGAEGRHAGASLDGGRGRAGRVPRSAAAR